MELVEARQEGVARAVGGALLAVHPVGDANELPQLAHVSIAHI